MISSQNNYSDTSKKFDYIISGAGCAGLSLLMHMIKSQRFSDKKILLIDKEIKVKNDRTWCFWEQRENLFEPIVSAKWNNLLFHSDSFNKNLNITPYQYKLIRGKDFYNFCLDQIKQQSNIHIEVADVKSVTSAAGKCTLVTDDDMYEADYIFNSILFDKPKLAKNEYWLLQHFKGWFIKATDRTFDQGQATLMDFRTDQKEGTTFFYVLPFSSTEALVEYTLFSEELLNDGEYEAALKDYVEGRLKIKSYEITEREFGVIPMTNYKFSAVENNIINLGTAGGDTKASSGYTFRFIQKRCAAIVSSLIEHDHPIEGGKNAKRFHFYDSVLLNILKKRKLRGADVFTDLFQKNDPVKILKFLDNETSVAEEIKIISTLPTMPFTKAAIDQIF